MISPVTVGGFGKLPTSVTDCIVRCNHGGLVNCCLVDLGTVTFVVPRYRRLHYFTLSI